ncbi:GNAT family acetyltransferase [Herbaspirillum rubrisubalbicans]|uniref:GNAT family acetyltransferase n=1 Tax=Herbaspirillum rubrisubalbicans TaxID=80842 RepID=A0ABX9C7E1_9BURK|nr:GNAT family N-acetyltransferase [Herbaspirillum rubrisubalbicans]RAM66855.1 GNAT family acetyltransferase [Herbaspirillum rubrisubalbicans]RAN47514.1 GNAT family acetyltransferase [Herbaspirillum rubrisubalbicans]
MIEILAFAPQHAQGVVDLILPIQQQEFDIPITLEGQPDLKDIAGFYQKGLGNFWVALDAGKVVGSISLLDIGNQQVALRKMFVAASHRGKEHGTAVRLLEGALAWAREQGVHQVFLGTTAKFLAAHRFYEKNGFRLIDKSDLPAAFPVMVVDTRFYALDC